MEKIDFEAKFNKVRKECAEACLTIFNENEIDEMVLLETIAAADEHNSVYPVDAVRRGRLLDRVYEKMEKFPDFLPESKVIDYYFEVHDSDCDVWRSPGDGDTPFNWAALYNVINATIDYFNENDIPASEWSNQELIGRNSDEDWEEEEDYGEE